jgi:16S rRNA processing protein RimM
LNKRRKKGRSQNFWESLIPVGEIVKPHGIRGDVKVMPFVYKPEHFLSFRSLWLRDVEGNRICRQICEARKQGNTVLLRFESVETRNQAEELRGMILEAHRSDCPDLPKGSFRVQDLVGLAVITDRGERLGSLDDVLHMPAHDIFVVRGEKGEFLIPAVKEYITGVDEAEGVINVKNMDRFTDTHED